MTHPTALFELGLPWDSLSAPDMEEYLSAWVSARNLRPAPVASIDEYYNLVSPRSVFFKTVPADSRVLDLGAGDGGLSVYKVWPLVVRPDVDLFALSLEWTDRFAQYAGVEIGNFETEVLEFGGIKFDAVMCSHFIEHIADLSKVLTYVEARLKSGGRLYLEWPHPQTKLLPRREFFIGRGLPVMTTNFFDDGTHQETWSMEVVAQNLLARGYKIENYGRIHFPFVADCLRDKARDSGDQVAGTFAVWCKTGWAQYLVCSKR